MKASTLFIEAVTLAIVLLCSSESMAQSKSYRTASALAESEVPLFEQKAHKGDVRAAIRLYRHYAIGLGDVKRGLKFACRAAELGSCDGAEIAADILVMPSFLNVQRAVQYRHLYERNCRLTQRVPTSTSMWATEAWELLREQGVNTSKLEPLRRMSGK